MSKTTLSPSTVSSTNLDHSQLALSPKKILYVLLEVPPTNMVLQEFAIPLAETHQISLCSWFKATSEVPANITLFEGDGTLRGFLRVLEEALKQEDYDIIHAHTPHVGLVMLFKNWWKPAFLKKTVFTIHNCYENHKRRNRWMMLPIFPLFSRLVCCSRSSYRSFPAVFRWLGGRRFGYVQNGVHTKRIAMVQEQLLNSGLSVERESDLFKVSSVGRLVPIKNLPVTVEAFAKVDSETLQLTFVGDGPLKDQLVNQSREAGIEKQVQFTGLVDREEVYRYFMESDLYISTSFGEGLPVGVLEAMACGCPVVLSDIEPHREIAEGVDFIPLIAPEDTAGFAREIKRYQELPAEERREIGQQCARLVTERFSLEAMHSGYEQVYESVLARTKECAPCK